MRTVSFRRLSCSDDGKMIFVGMAKWDDKPAPPAKAEIGAEAIADKDPAGRPGRRGAPTSAYEPLTVEIWHAKDVFVMPWQKIHSAR
jgi:hypothetical protein